MEATLPSLTAVDSSPFLRALSVKGFTRAVHFPRRVLGRTCKALGAGLLPHLDIKYPVISSFLEKTWKVLKVREFVQLRADFQGDLENHFPRGEFWTAVEVAVKETIANYQAFPKPKRNALLERGDININDPDFLRSAAEVLMLTILLIQTSESGYIQSTLLPGSQHIGLFVVLALDRDELYLMLHEGLAQASGRSGVPYYYREEDNLPIASLLENSYQAAPSASDSQRIEQIVLEKLAYLADVLTKFGVTATLQFPQLRSTLSDSVLPAILEFEALSSYTLERFPFSEDLQQLRQMAQSSQETSLTGSHYAQDCYRYYTDYPYAVMTCCGKQMHVYCFSEWVKQCYDSSAADVGFKVTCPICKLEQPESLLEQQCPAVYAELQEKKKQLCLRVTAPDPRVPDSASFVGARAYSLGTSPVCSSCNHSRQLSWFYTSQLCSCKICLVCAQANTHCPGCSRSYLSTERAAIQSSYQRVRSPS